MSGAANRYSPLQQLIGALGFISACLFSVGWTYMTHYYYAFGMTTSSVSAPFQIFVTYSYVALKTPLAAAVLAVALVYVALRIFGKANAEHIPVKLSWLPYFMDIIMLLGVLYLLNMVAMQSGKDDASSRQKPSNNDLPRIEFFGKDYDQIASKVFDETCKLRLLYFGNGNFYVFCPSKAPEEIAVVIIPGGLVQATRLTLPSAGEDN